MKRGDTWLRLRRLPNRHSLEEELGSGGMGIIHLGIDPVLRRRVAVKSLMRTDENALKRFANEALVTAQLDHPYIVPVYGMETDPSGNPAYAMKLVEGETLKDLLQRSAEARQAGGEIPRELQLTSLLELFLKMCDAVAFAHERQILHRDLKPSNVMIGAHGELYVMDWGLAKAKSGTALDLDASRVSTVTNQLLGTPRYMAPEQAEGEYSPASDQYALGLILYRMVSTRDPRPIRGAYWVTIQQAAEGKFRPLAPAHADEPVWPHLYDVVNRALEREPEARFSSVAQLAEAVRWARDRPPVELPEQQGLLRRWIARHLDATLYLGVAMSVLLALLVAGAITASVLGVEIYATQQKAREQRTASLLGQVGERAGELDRSLGRVQAHLESVVAAAEALHVHGRPSNTHIYAPADFHVADKRPPDAEYNDLYSRVLSTRFPDVSMAPGIERDQVWEELQRVIPVRERLRKAQLDIRREMEDLSLEEAELAWKTRPGPLRWAMVATDSGFAINVPGGFFETASFDHRVRPWFTLGAGRQVPTWGLPWQELSTGRLMIACSMELRGEQGRFGAASLAVSFSYLTAEALTLDHPGVKETFLLSPEGNVMLRSSEADTVGRVGALSDSWTTPPYAHLDVLKGKLDLAGVERVDGGTTLVARHPLSLGWTYLVELDAAAAGF